MVQKENEEASRKESKSCRWTYTSALKGNVPFVHSRNLARAKARRCQVIIDKGSSAEQSSLEGLSEKELCSCQSQWGCKPTFWFPQQWTDHLCQIKKAGKQGSDIWNGDREFNQVGRCELHGIPKQVQCGSSYKGLVSHGHIWIHVNQVQSNIPAELRSVELRSRMSSTALKGRDQLTS